MKPEKFIRPLAYGFAAATAVFYMGRGTMRAVELRNDQTHARLASRCMDNVQEGRGCTSQEAGAVISQNEINEKRAGANLMALHGAVGGMAVTGAGVIDLLVARRRRNAAAPKG